MNEDEFINPADIINYPPTNQETPAEKYIDTILEEEYKMKSVLFRTFCAILLGLVLFVMKFILKEERFVEEVYNYIATDIVFLK